MSTDTAELVDIDVDLDAPVICAVEVCDAVATVVLVALCTKRHTDRYCANHAQAQRYRAASMCISGHQVLCAACREVLPCPHLETRPL